MTVIEQKKFRLIRSIMNADAKKVSEVEKIFGFEQTPSSMCSADELRESVRQQLDELKAGKTDFISHEQLKRKVI
ncbi:MAG: hypothetical protein LBL04_15560 [Bacteroidales bacterium]|nr:hypothetical protein [Bacteroidales bacterium]